MALLIFEHTFMDLFFVKGSFWRPFFQFNSLNGLLKRAPVAIWCLGLPGIGLAFPAEFVCLAGLGAQFWAWRVAKKEKAPHEALS